MLLKVSIVSPPCVMFSPCQPAERRPQTRPDLESYEKARDYFSEGKKINKHTNIRRTLCTVTGNYVAFVASPTLTFLYPCSTEKAARWWLFQESSLSCLPVSHDSRPHQSLPIQRFIVSECKNSKCPCGYVAPFCPFLNFSFATCKNFGRA